MSKTKKAESLPPTPAKRRSKTFTGCYTCRSRKIRCDLGRPVCQKCTKSKIACAGYDINLRWSNPIKYNPKTGDAISSSYALFPKTSDTVGEDETGEGGDTSFPVLNSHRRHVGFVHWDKEKHHRPYFFYDEMDTDLGILHGSSSDPMVSKSKTKMLGPFGVFQGTELSKSITTLSNNGNASEIATRNSTILKDESNLGRTTSERSMASNGRDDVKNDSKRPRKTDLLANQAVPQDQLWLSNELRDDALLTAAALNGDAQFLDFMSTLSTPNSNVFTPVNFQNYNTSTNQNDFLNLVFHRNHSNGVHPSQNGMVMMSDNQEPNFQEMGQPHQQHQPQLIQQPQHHQQPHQPHQPQQSQQTQQTQQPQQPQQTQQTQQPQQPQQPHQPQQLQQELSQPQFGFQQLPDQSLPLSNDQYYSNYSDYYYNNPYKQNEDLEIHLHASSARHNSRIGGNEENEPKTDIVEGEQNSNSTTMPTSIMCTVQSMLEPELGFEITIPPTSPKNQNQNQRIPPGLPTTALQVQPLTRYLLNYYVTLVADLMTVIPLTENPWKSIYFARALMAIGELLALGHTSDAKNALLNALLAVLAFNLQSKFPKNSPPMKYYLNLGIRLRNQASVFVKKLLNSSGGIENCVRNEKYKDVLCAVMSMISVDLVWGTMQDTNYYINWCGKVIATKMINKKKLSTKARILHRIFGSLKLIQDSTCLDVESIRRDHERDYDVNGDKFGNGSNTTANENHKESQNDAKTDKNKIDFLLTAQSKNGTATPIRKSTSPAFHNKKLINIKKNDENFATDALYGLPNSLIILFSEIVTLVRTNLYHKQNNTNVPPNFRNEVDEVDKKLANWKLDWVLQEVEKGEEGGEERPWEERKFLSPMHEATFHHIMSFYHALNIYFNRLILLVPGEKLQVSVKKTLDHLNAIQILISKNEANIIPLFWQGFIAGCEAISQELQMGFKKWGADIAQYLGSYWGARQIMLEVWRRKRMNEGRDDWVSVIQDWEMNLMLN